MNVIHNKWDVYLSNEYSKEYFLDLMNYLDNEYKNAIVYPSRDKIFNAFNFVDYDNVKVVILGQDPYHGEGQANGMAFAVNDGVTLPPSLVNIYKEIESDLGIELQEKGSLIGWAKQGVLLLNTVLTVRKSEPYSHSDIGWQRFTDAAIACLNKSEKPIVYLLWGKGAIQKKHLISSRHCILTSPHPSPLSAYRGFFGCRHFSKTNAFLAKNSHTPIDWQNTEGFELADYYANAKTIKRI